MKVADRELVEQEAEALLLEPARTQDIALLVVGDPFGATTHTDLVTRCSEKGIPFAVVHNASIMNAAGACGMQLYNFGRTVSICFFTDNWRPDSFYPKIKQNRDIGLHTLCLLGGSVGSRARPSVGATTTAAAAAIAAAASAAAAAFDAPG